MERFSILTEQDTDRLLSTPNPVLDVSATDAERFGFAEEFAEVSAAHVATDDAYVAVEDHEANVNANWLAHDDAVQAAGLAVADGKPRLKLPKRISAEAATEEGLILRAAAHAQRSRLDQAMNRLNKKIGANGRAIAAEDDAQLADAAVNLREFASGARDAFATVLGIRQRAILARATAHAYQLKASPSKHDVDRLIPAYAVPLLGNAVQQRVEQTARDGVTALAEFADILAAIDLLADADRELVPMNARNAAA